MMVYNDELKNAREKGDLYVGVYANHTKRVKLIRIPKSGSRQLEELEH